MEIFLTSHLIKDYIGCKLRNCNKYMYKVLIIEDENAYQKILKDAFEKEDFEVTVASDYKQVMHYVGQNRPDIILLDVMLPGGVNGFDLLERLKANKTTRNIPVIIITNVASEEKVAQEIGTSFYFIKSETTISQIIEKVKQILSKPVDEGGEEDELTTKKSAKVKV